MILEFWKFQCGEPVENSYVEQNYWNFETSSCQLIKSFK